MVAALAVPVQGFPVPRAQVALSASGEVETLILPAWMDEEEELALVASSSYQERKRALAAEIVVPRDRVFLRRRAVLAASVSEG